MKPIKKLADNFVEWSQPKAMHRHYEMRGDGEIIATLTWKKLFGSLAVAECAEESYSLKRGGFLRPYITVRKLDLDNEVATMQMGLGHNGVLTFQDGRSFRFQKLSFWKSQWGFIDENNKIVCTFNHKTPRLKEAAEVSIEGKAKSFPYLLLMLIVGWYTIILIQQESAAAAGAAGAS